MAFITPASAKFTAVKRVPILLCANCAGLSAWLKSRGSVWLLLGLWLFSLGAAWATGFTVINAGTRLDQGIYRLDASISYELSKKVLGALDNGVPLTIQLQIQVLRQREWLWDELSADIQQRFRLEYHALARQYLVTNLNNGELNSFPTLWAATDFLGQVHDFPLIDSSLVQLPGTYYGRLRTRLDIEALPAPLRPVAYLSADWRLTSAWYTWLL